MNAKIGLYMGLFVITGIN
ncbi:MAG: sortase B protein-sorting domain-containing protein [Sphingobacteriaceae bacterium]|nr:sortase B protein-sorting domain-containing protein [Sphingobacteriaceae bacterium]MBP8032965.1 sortase B protein-sorting domain-containing protein [Bacteroidia bacterium]